MKKYRPGDEVGTLHHWPLDNPSSNYRIIDGDPKTFGRIELGGSGYLTRYGVWRCTPGTFECTELGDELMTVLSGRCRITWLSSNQSTDLEPGDTLFIRDGCRVRWLVEEELTKVFFGHKANGY